MADVFTWVPSFSSTVTPKPRVLQAQFGDGYSQRVADGLNAVVDSVDLTFNALVDADADAIDAFLRKQGGVTPFLFAFPGKPQYGYVCQIWKFSYVEKGIKSLQCTFNQVFDSI